MLITASSRKFTQTTAKATEAHKEAIQIDYCYKGGLSITGATADSPCYDDTHCENITISNCEFVNCPNGIGTHVVSKGEDYHTGVTIKDCKFDVEGNAIRLLGMKDVDVCGCGNVKIMVDRAKKAHTSTGKVTLDNYRENRNVIIDSITIK